MYIAIQRVSLLFRGRSRLTQCAFLPGFQDTARDLVSKERSPGTRLAPATPAVFGCSTGPSALTRKVSDRPTAVHGQVTGWVSADLTAQVRQVAGRPLLYSPANLRPMMLLNLWLDLGFAVVFFLVGHVIYFIFDCIDFLYIILYGFTFISLCFLNFYIQNQL